ncbi:MAG: MerR family transcriptional regulator [Candidatus Binatia bacterium]
MSIEELPDRLYFRIGEVARLLGVKPYVLRYWEAEFNLVRPAKTSARHRLYRRRDLEVLLEIRRLLYTERYTIEGARRRLREPARASSDTVLAEVRAELTELHRMLASDPAPIPTLGLVK